VESNTPYPYQLCYCSICRKTSGGGGFAINIMGIANTLKIQDKSTIGVFQAKIGADGDGNGTHLRKKLLYKVCYSVMVMGQTMTRTHSSICFSH